MFPLSSATNTTNKRAIKMDVPKDVRGLPKIIIVVHAQKLLKICSLMPYEGWSKRKNVCVALLSYIFLLLNALPCTAPVVYQIIVGYEDIYAMVESSIAACDILIFCYSLICYTRQLNVMDKIFNDINVFLEFCDLSVIEDAEKEAQFYSKTFTIYFFVGLMINALFPVINIKNCQKGRLSEFYLKHDPCGNIVRNVFPFDTTPIAVMAIVNFSNAMASLYICFGFLAITMVLVGLIIHVIAQLRNLKRHLAIIFKDTERIEDMEQEINFCVRYHVAIIDYMERIFAVFSMLVLVHITITSGIFAVILFFILRLETYADKTRYAAHLGGWLAMLFITCYYGQYITDESASIAEAAYGSSWYNAPPKLRKNVQLMILRAQRPLTLKAASVGPILLPTYAAVIKGAYSFFTFMVSGSDS